MNARDRGVLIHRLADLMDEHKEELATIESIDSGAVYTLALKTHVGMSIDTWRYFAGTRPDLDRNLAGLRHWKTSFCDSIDAHVSFPLA